MRSFSHIGIFIDRVHWSEVDRFAGRGQDGLILDQEATGRLLRRQVKLPSALPNRIIVPVTATKPAQIRRQAEKLTLLGDNVWVQLPVMTNGTFNGNVVRQLLHEGIPLAVSGVASKQQAYQLLRSANAETAPLLLELCPAASRYDAIVTVALAHLLPQVQVISKAQASADFWDIQKLGLDGAIFDQPQLTRLRQLAADDGGQVCDVLTHQQYELALN